MEVLNIKYIFTFSDDVEESYNLALDASSLELVNNDPEELPPWTKLDFQKCPNCVLNTAESVYCPLAVKLVNLICNCSAILSYDNVHVTVITPERTITKHTTAQQGVSSIMGLIMPTSGCPHTSYFRPMARFHLPFSSEEETIYRSTSMYLLAQYFAHKQGEAVDYDFKKLKEIYQNLHVVNSQFANRLRAASEKDSSVNALIILDLFTKTLPCVIKESLEELRYLFKPFLYQN